MTIGERIAAPVPRRSIFGENLRRRRLAMGLSTAGLADLIQNGATKSSINRWELGLFEPRLSDVERLAAALHTTPSDLVGWTDEACTTPSGTTTPEIINPDTTHPHDLKGGNPNMITLNDLLALTNARTVRCTLAVTPRLTATIMADITQPGQLDDLSALYGACEITEVDGRDGCLAVTLRRGGGSHDA